MSRRPASALPRILKAASALLTGLLFITCADPSGPVSRGSGSVSVRPVFNGYARFAPVTLDRVRVVVERVTPDSTREGTLRDTLRDETRSFSATSTQLRLSLPVPLQQETEDLDVSLILLADNTVLFQGTLTTTVTRGSNEATSIPVDYVGPGANAVGLIIEPFDTTVTAGSHTSFRAVAINGQEQDVGAFYMSWSLGGAGAGASIDATGRLTAPNGPDTLYVRGILPNGVDDSVQVFVTAAPTAMTRAGGDGQSGTPGVHLPGPLSVLVTGSGGAPVPGVRVTWAATIGGGFVDTVNTTTNASGIAQTGVTLGPNPGLQIFTATSAGLGSVTFSANQDQTGSAVTWQGTTSTVWSVASNWVGGKVPNVLDSVVIPTAQFYPVLDTTPIISALVLTGNSTLTINAHGLAVIRGLTLSGNARLEMSDQSDVLTVGGNAIFGGGDSRGHLTAGVLSLGGNFTQRSTTSGQSFSASGEHITSFVGPTPQITFDTPGLGTGQSGFNDVIWSGSGTLTIGSDLVAGRTAYAGFGSSGTITSTGGFDLQASAFITNGQTPVVMNNVTLSLTESAPDGPSTSLTGITFQNMPTNRSQITVTVAGGSFTFTSVTFTTVPGASGAYIEANDTDINNDIDLRIDMINPNPATSGGHVVTTGGAIVNWPAP